MFAYASATVTRRQKRVRAESDQLDKDGDQARFQYHADVLSPNYWAAR